MSCRTQRCVCVAIEQVTHTYTLTLISLPLGVTADCGHGSEANMGVRDGLVASRQEATLIALLPLEMAIVVVGFTFPRCPFMFSGLTGSCYSLPLMPLLPIPNSPLYTCPPPPSSPPPQVPRANFCPRSGDPGTCSFPGSLLLT